MRKKVLSVALFLGLTGGTVGVTATAAAAFPPPGQCKNVGGHCSGQSESAGPHCAELPAGQQKKC
jgi:hypothetical protein